MDEDRIPWIFRLLYDFPYALDLLDDNGEPDHDKMIPTFAATAFIIFLFRHPRPDWEAMIAMLVIGAYIYGFAAWRIIAPEVIARRGLNAHIPESAKTGPTASQSAGVGDPASGPSEDGGD